MLREVHTGFPKEHLCSPYLLTWVETFSSQLICLSEDRSTECLSLTDDPASNQRYCSFVFVYLSWLPVAHLSDAARRRLVV